MYKSITSLIKKPLSFLFGKAVSANLQSSTIGRDGLDQKKHKKKRKGGLTALDELIFRYSKPNLEFLQESYGLKAQYIKATNDQMQPLQLSWVSTSQNRSYSQDEEQRIPNQMLFIPFVLFAGYTQTQDDTVDCFFWNKSPVVRNKLDQRIVLLQYAANNPIEDRYKCSQLQQIDGFVVSVFDGHGGWQVAELATNSLHKQLDQFLLQNKDKYQDQDTWVQQSIADAYAAVEEEFYQVALQAYQMGFPSVARVGACALTAVIVNDKVYSANLGDCKGVLVNLEKRSKEAYRKINHMLNANSKKEQLRLKSVFTDDDIVVCRRGPKSCYVKGRLQPTRSLGDFRLKFEEFNNPGQQPTDKGFAEKIKNFKGPYISATPDQKVFKLEKGERFLVMGSDGLWDELTKDDIAKLAQKHAGNKDEMIKAIFEEALKHAAKTNNLSEDELKQLPLGKRRKIHDDITVVVVDLDQQLS